MTLIAEGVSTREVAERLGISYVTTRNHVQVSLQKLGVTSRVEAARILHERKLQDAREVVLNTRMLLDGQRSSSLVEELAKLNDKLLEILK